MPSPLDAKIGGPRSNGRYVDTDRSYLVSFVWQETNATGGSEVHVNFRGYPGRTKIPVCRESNYTAGKQHYTIPADDPRGGKSKTVTAPSIRRRPRHVLYAWHHKGLYTSGTRHRLERDAGDEEPRSRMRLQRLTPRPPAPTCDTCRRCGWHAGAPGCGRLRSSTGRPPPPAAGPLRCC
jgi:hypothetical protein